MSRLSLWLPVVAYMAILFWVSSYSVPPGSEFVPVWLDADWLQHALAYGGLALVTLRAVAYGRWLQVSLATVAMAWLVATLYGVTDEIHQLFVPGRSSDLRDIVADGSGAALALGAAWAWSIIKRAS